MKKIEIKTKEWSLTLTCGMQQHNQAVDLRPVVGLLSYLVDCTR